MNPYAAPETLNLGVPRQAVRNRVSLSERLLHCYSLLFLCRPRAWTTLTLLVVLLWFTYGIIRNWSSPDRARAGLDTRQVQWRLEEEMNDVAPLPIGWPLFSVRPIGWFKWDTNFSPVPRSTPGAPHPGTPGAIANFFPFIAVFNFVLFTAASIAVVYVCQNGRKQRLAEVSLITIVIVIGVSLLMHKSRQSEVKAGIDLLVNVAYFIPVLCMFFSMVGHFLFPRRGKAEPSHAAESQCSGF